MGGERREQRDGGEGAGEERDGRGLGGDGRRQDSAGRLQAMEKREDIVVVERTGDDRPLRLKDKET